MTTTWLSEVWTAPSVEDKIAAVLYVASLMAIFSAILTILL